MMMINRISRPGISRLILFAACFSITLLIGVQPAFSQTQTGDTWAKVKSTGKGEISVVWVEASEFVFQDDEGRITGVEGDIFSEFVKFVERKYKIDLAVNYVKAPDFRTFYDGVTLSNGGVFGLGTVSVLEKRKNEVQFAPGYIRNMVVLVSGSECTELSSLQDISEDFAGMKAVIVPGTIIEDRMKRLRDALFPNLEFVSATSQNEAIEMISRSDGELFSCVDLAHFWPARQNGMRLRRHSAGDQLKEELATIMPVNSDWGPVIREFFEIGNGGFKANPRYRQILARHLGPGFYEMLQLAGSKQMR